MPYLTLRGSTYWYRRAIPKNIRTVLGRGGLWFVSLGTKDYTEAKRLCSAKNAEVEALFAAARKKIAPEPKRTTITPINLLDFESAQRVVADAVQDRERAAFQQIMTLKDRRKLESMAARAALRRRLLTDPRDFDDPDPAVALWKTTLTERGYIAAPETGEFQFGLDQFRAELADTFRRVAEWANRDFRDVPPHATKPRGLTIMQLFAAYAADRDAADRAADDDRPTLRMLTEVIGSDIEAAKVTRAHILAFKDMVTKKPRNVKHADRGLTLPQLVAKFEGQQIPRLTPTSVKKYLATIKSMFTWGVNNDKVPSNPATGVVARVKKNAGTTRKPRAPFSEADIKTIFTSPLYAGAKSPSQLTKPGNFLIADHHYWLPLLALFTGARLTELGQLNVADVKKSARGTWYFDITTEFDEEDAITHPELVKKLKNESSIRKVPIHKTLIELGFLDYLKTVGRVKVFPGLRADSRGRLTGNYSKKFGRWLRATGITSKTKVFHSFRHSFKDACRAAMMQEEVHDRLTGHARPGVGAAYGDGHSVEVLAAAINKVEFLTFVSPPKREYATVADDRAKPSAKSEGRRVPHGAKPMPRPRGRGRPNGGAHPVEHPEDTRAHACLTLNSL